MKRFTKFLERKFSPKNLKLNEVNKSAFLADIKNKLEEKEFNSYFTKDISNYIVNQVIKKRLYDRNAEHGFLPMQNQQMNQVKVLGFNNSLIHNSIWVNLEEKDVNLESELFLSEADIFFITKEIFKHLKLENINEVFLFKIINERGIKLKSDFQNAIFEIIGHNQVLSNKQNRI